MTNIKKDNYEIFEYSIKHKYTFRKLSQISRKVLLEILITPVFIILTLTPVIWGILTSFKAGNDIAVYPPKIINFSATIDNYRTILNGGILRAFSTSLFYTISAIVISLFFGMLAAYGMKRYRFRGRVLLFYAVLTGIPLASGSAALVISNYVFFSKLGMIDKWYTLVLIYSVYHLPMTIWILKGGLDNIPFEIEEAATVDGCSRPYIIFYLIPKLNSPAMASVAILTFIGTWNEFIVASVMINTSNLRPLQVVIYNFIGYFGLQWGPLCAASTVSIVFLLIVFIILGKQLVSGLTQGSVKG